MEKAELMQKEIENKRKLPKELKESINKSIFHNLIIAIIIMVYLCTINVLFYILDSDNFEQKMKFFALGIIIITVGFFEIAYRRESKRVCIIGIELLICSIISLYIPYIYLHTNEVLRKITMILPVFLAIYYVFKAILIYKGREIKYQSNLSDVKEILKETEKQSYLEEESTKTFRENKKIEEKIKQEILQEQQIRKNRKKRNNTKKDSYNDSKSIKNENNAKKKTQNKNITTKRIKKVEDSKKND